MIRFFETHPWLALTLAGLLEVGWAYGLKLESEQPRNLAVLAGTIVLMVLSFYFLSLALKSIPMGTAYAVWTGIGALGTVLVGIVIFKEPRTALRLLFLLGLVLCLVGLKLTATK